MPASETTGYDQNRLHFLFGIAGVCLLLSTLWMFGADHNREWKHFQKTARDVEVRMTEWRELQYANDAHERERVRLADALSSARSRALPEGRVDAFLDEIRRDAERRGASVPDGASMRALESKINEASAAAESPRKESVSAEVAVDQRRTQLEEASAAHQKAIGADGEPAESERLAADVAERKSQLAEARRVAADSAKARREAEEAVAAPRSAMIDRLTRFVTDAKFREDSLLVQRKFKNAEYDKERANLDLGVRDRVSEGVLRERQAAVDALTARVGELTLQYQAAADHRKKLQSIVDELTSAEAEAAKKLADHSADFERLAKTARERDSRYRVGLAPGKRWLELPILDAFNSPLKIDNLWSDGLEQNYNFRTVRRFDRCTTCHKGIDKTLPGSGVEGAYEHEQTIVFTIETGAEDESSEGGEGGGSSSAPSSSEPAPIAAKELAARLEAAFGLRLADEGLIAAHDVTVSFVVPRSLGARARPAARDDVPRLEPNDVREIPIRPVAIEGTHLVPGLLAGDVIAEVNGDRVTSAERAAFALLAAADRRESIRLLVRRGLPHPYASHPRLDLYVGSTSPHKVADFACTICHEGQGSATDFKWASHTPNSPEQRKEWAEEHGWFDNHHWIYPMNARRFLESACLKCHHGVTELEPSERFPDAPAPALTHGHQLILKYGCFGCHEINGYDGDRRIGPDLRTEPNFFAAAQQLKADARTAGALTSDEASWVETIIEHPERDGARRNLYRALVEDDKAPEPRFSESARRVIAPVLKDVESPGRLRKPGPSLRFVRHKVDDGFLYDWIREPKNFRPSTRMPRFFGHRSHLDGKGRETAERYEPVEILSMAHYLRERSQPFEYLARPDGVSEAAVDEKIARGKIAFEQRGCLACHGHADFPDVDRYRPANKIQQGPDLSGLGDKFAADRNPNGRAWLYSWLKKPNRYHVRTAMPDTFLDPIATRDESANVVSVTDPAEDITEYLLASRSGWAPPPGTLTAITDDVRGAVDGLALEYLREAFFVSAAEKYVAKGIPADMAAELNGAERELVVPVEQFEQDASRVSDSQKLAYLGRKSIGKYGCYACHDIPGFEDAKPIGTALADWGRKAPAQLAFEHIAEYLEHGHAAHPGAHAPPGAEPPAPHSENTNDAGPDADGARDADPESDAAADQGAADASMEAAAPNGSPPNRSEEDDELPEFYREQLHAGNRIGFLYQKLREPRGYDYHKTTNKKYNEWLRMPLFPLNANEREAIVTFVLGLVAEPPAAKYVCRPDARTQALLDGAVVLEKYNCGGCHVIEGERWKLAYRAGTFGEPTVADTFDLTLHHAGLDQRTASARPDHRDLLHATVEGLPVIDNDGLPQVFDIEGEPLFEDEKYSPLNVLFGFMLMKPAMLDGFAYQVQQGGIQIRGADVDRRYPSNGGDLTKYLLPRIVTHEQQAIPTLKGSEAWGWLPPPLIGQGTKVHAEWLHGFLLDPHPIRPGAVLRMPRFNMSPDEAAKLVNYFAARDDASFPYNFNREKRSDHLAAKEAEYQTVLAKDAPEVKATRFDHAMRIVTNKQYCIQCHIVGDFVPAKEERGKGPDLSQIYDRLRPDYLRRWIARPTSVLPYTGMPVNIPYKAGEPFDGTTVPQDLYHGTALQQVDALVDLLSNYDRFAATRSKVQTLVEAQAAETPAAPAEGGATSGASGTESSDNQ
ncbi:MAG: hypothetical protein FJ297_02570 [Planctomycetes bacterium]|nr:hypothetical protein [Planctomycetota bacterium]